MLFSVLLWGPRLCNESLWRGKIEGGTSDSFLKRNKEEERRCFQRQTCGEKTRSDWGGGVGEQRELLSEKSALKCS